LLKSAYFIYIDVRAGFLLTKFHKNLKIPDFFVLNNTVTAFERLLIVQGMTAESMS